MRLVIDASVAVKWLIEEEGSDAARRLAASGEDMHAPRLMASEVANALWRKARLGEIDHGRARASIAAIPEMPVLWNADETLSVDALRFALTLDRAVYDCVYLALARRIDGRLVTADARFANALAQTGYGGTVVALADYSRT